MNALLDQVGLNGMLHRETGTLSGGQLQRLAIAAALSRRPAVLISDESTAMIDQEGRAAVNGLFRSLADRNDTAVLQITHDTDESAVADREIVLDSRRSAVSTRLRTTTGAVGRIQGAKVNLFDVGYAHDAGTPWHNQIFSGLNLTFEAGSAVLLTGPNGAGKSTLARVLTGLQQPTSGHVLVDGMPVQNGRRHALLGFQYSRLQLVRSRVRADIKNAAGVDDTAANAALLELGLNSAELGDALVDQLSVGQQRRVALAGLLACKPRLLVLDEPLAGLDTPARSAMVAALQRVKASGTTLIVISHDVGELADLVDRTIVVDKGTVDGQPVTPAPPASSLKSTANLASVVRTLPHASVARRWWVGTKLIVLAAIALMFALEPTWLSVAVGVAIAASWTVLGKVPRAAVPRLPLWLIGVTLLGGFVTAMGGDEPYVTVGGVELGLGGAAYWGILICMTVVSLYSALLFCWTTPMVEIPAFAQRLVGWAARFGIPAQSAAVSVALALRLCPFLISDFRTLLQTIAQRRSDEKQTARERIAGWAACLPIVCSLACQNGRELAAAIEARGGIGSVSRSDRSPRFIDLVVLIVVLGSVGAVIALG
jgi:energy-coupling factor transport system ATP-binding protein